MKQNRTLSTKKLGLKAQTVLRALLENESVRAAARAAGVSPGVVYRLLHDPSFTEALETARRACFDEALGKLKGSSAKAVDRLVHIMGMDDIAEARRAAQAIITLTLRAAETIEIEQRLGALERRIAGAQATDRQSGDFLMGEDKRGKKRGDRRSEISASAKEIIE